MDDSKSVDSSIAVDDLFENLKSLSFGNGAAGLDDLAEVTALAKLGDYAGVAFTFIILKILTVMTFISFSSIDADSII